MAQFALAKKRDQKLTGETVHAYTSTYSTYGGHVTHLKRNALGELCQPEERKATTWKTKAGAEKKLKELQAMQDRLGSGSGYRWSDYEVVEIGLTDAEMRDNLFRNYRAVLAALKDADKLDLVTESK